MSAEEAFVKSLSKLPSTDEDFQEQSTVLCAWKSIYETVYRIFIDRFLEFCSYSGSSELHQDSQGRSHSFFEESA